MKITLSRQCSCGFIPLLFAILSFLSCNDLDSISPYDPLKNPTDPKYPDRYEIDMFKTPFQGIGDINLWCIGGIPTDTIITHKVLNSSSTEAWDKNGFVPERTSNVMKIDFNVNKIGQTSTFGGISIRMIDQWVRPFNLFKLNMEYLTFKVKADASINMGIGLKGSQPGDLSKDIETCPKRLLSYRDQDNNYYWKPSVKTGEEYTMDTTWREVRIPIGDLLHHLQYDYQTKIETTIGTLDISRLKFITLSFGYDEFENCGGNKKGTVYITDIAFERGASSYAYPAFQIDQFTPPPDTGKVYFVVNKPEKQPDMYIYLRWGTLFYRGVLDASFYSGAVLRLLHLNDDQQPIRIVTDGTIVGKGTIEPLQYSDIKYQILHLGGAF